MADDPQAVRYVGDAFTRAGYVPVVAGDPGDVPRLMAEHKPHLALLDLVLPEGDGIGLMYDIQGAADVPIIFLSAYGQDDTVARALEMGPPTTWSNPSRPRSWRPGHGRPSGGGWSLFRASRHDPTP